MTPLRQRFIEDMQLRGLAPTTQRSYLHYTIGFAAWFNTSPEKLDLEAIRQYELHLLNQRKLSPESVNTFISSVQFLYTVTLEMPWDKKCGSSAKFVGKFGRAGRSSFPLPATLTARCETTDLPTSRGSACLAGLSVE